MQFRTNCIKNSIDLQRQIINSEKALFALNPQSTGLQLNYNLTKAELIAASIANNYPAVIKLGDELTKIHLQQIKLDSLQRSIITGAQISINASLMKLTLQFNSDSRRLKNLWQGFLNILFIIDPPAKPQIAVKAVTSGIAPNYELTLQYKRTQKVAFVWHMKYSTRREQQKLVHTENQFEVSCQALPNQNGDQWNIEL